MHDRWGRRDMPGRRNTRAWRRKDFFDNDNDTEGVLFTKKSRHRRRAKKAIIDMLRLEEAADVMD